MFFFTYDKISLEKKMHLSGNIQGIKSYKPARHATGKKWFVEYYICNIALKKIVHKKIILNTIEKDFDRRTYANIST
ncbi:MAG: hypothetical protein ACOYN4_09875 [Bacteroidales bacterium]